MYLPDGMVPMPVEREERKRESMLGTRRDGSTQDIARTLPGLRSSGPDDDYGVRWERWPP
jgi:hypothetical protein